VQIILTGRKKETAPNSRSLLVTARELNIVSDIFCLL